MTAPSPGSSAIWILSVAFLLATIVSWNWAAAEERYLQVPALGQRARLGDLYDETTGQFRPISIFHSPIHSKSISKINDNKVTATTLTTKTPRSIKEKFQLLNIDSNTAVNILSGLIQVDGSAGSYLADTLHGSATDVSGLLLVKYTTVQENLEIFSKQIRKKYNRDILEHQTASATHFVTGIKWGSIVALTLKARATTPEAQENLTIALENEFKIIKAASPAPKDSPSNFSLTYTADVGMPIQEPTSLREVQDLLRQMTVIIQNTEGGKGIQLEFTLSPLGAVREQLKIPEKAVRAADHVKCDEWVLQKFLTIFDEILSVEQQIRDLTTSIFSNAICLTKETLRNVTELQSQFLVSKTRFTDQFRETMVNVRRGFSPPTTLLDLAKNYSDSENYFSLKNLEDKLAQFNQARQKVQLFNMFRAANSAYGNIEYFGANNDFNVRLEQNLKHVIYVLFQKSSFIENDPSVHNKNVNMFLSTLNRPFNKLFVVDCDFPYSQCEGLKQTVIKQVIDGEFTIQDVAQEFQKSSETSSVNKPVKMKAIGRFAEIGELFDARTDSFLEQTVIEPSKIQNFKSRACISARTFTIHSECPSEKFKALKIEPELQYSILTNSIPLTRSGQYFNQQHQDGGILNSITATIVNVKRLSKKRIRVTDPEFINSFHVKVALRSPATHFVTHIDYGFKTIFYVECLNASITTDQWTAYLQSLKEIIFCANEITQQNQLILNTTQSLDVLTEFQSNYKITVFSDIQAVDETPIVIESRKDLLAYLNKFIQQQYFQNSGQGQPISYVLYPIDNLRRDLGVFGEVLQFGSVSSSSEDPAVFSNMMTEVSTAKIQIQQLARDIKKNPECTSDEDSQTFLEIKSKFEKTLGHFSQRFKNVVRLIKSGIASVASLTDLKEDFTSHHYFSGDGRYKELKRMGLFEQKLQLYKRLVGSSVRYLGREHSDVYFNFIFSDQNYNQFRYYLLFYKPEWVREKEETWRRVSHVFFNSLTGGKGNGNGSDVSRTQNQLLYLVDCDFRHPMCENMTGPAIQEYKDGKLTSADFPVAAEKEINWQKVVSEMTSKIQEMDSKIASLTASFNTNQSLIDNRTRTIHAEIVALRSQVAGTHENINAVRHELLNSTAMVQEKWEKFVGESELEQSPVYAPYAAKEGQLKDLRWIRNLIIANGNLELRAERAKLNNWVVRLEEAESVFDGNGTLKPLKLQEKEFAELLDEQSLFSFAGVLYDKAKYAEALGLYERMFKGREATLGLEHVNTLKAQFNVAVCLDTLNENSRAIHLYRFVYEKYRDTLGPDHVSTVAAKHNIAHIIYKQGKYADALRIFQQVYDNEGKIFGSDHANTLQTKTNMEAARKALGVILN